MVTTSMEEIEQTIDEQAKRIAQTTGKDAEQVKEEIKGNIVDWLITGDLKASLYDMVVGSL